MEKHKDLYSYVSIGDSRQNHPRDEIKRWHDLSKRIARKTKFNLKPHNEMKADTNGMAYITLYLIKKDNLFKERSLYGFCFECRE